MTPQEAQRIDHLATEIGRHAVGCITMGAGWVCLADLCDELKKAALAEFDRLAEMNVGGRR